MKPEPPDKPELPDKCKLPDKPELPDKCPHCGGEEFASRNGGFDIFRPENGGLVYTRTESGDGYIDELLCNNCGETIKCDLTGVDIS